MSKAFIEAFNALAKEAHKTAIEKKWWDLPIEYQEIVRIIHADGSLSGSAKARLDSFLYRKCDRNDAELIDLMHTELSEATEAMRHGNPPDDKIPEFSGLEAELADCVIRIADMSEARNLRVGEAIIAKMQMNKSRPERHGGKLF